MSLPETHAELLAELDSLLDEAPVDVGDLIEELAQLQAKGREARATERPGCEEGGCR